MVIVDINGMNRKDKVKLQVTKVAIENPLCRISVTEKLAITS